MKYSDRMKEVRLNLLNKKFNLLLVLEVYKTQIVNGVKTSRKFLCLCDCGKIVLRSSSAVCSGRTVSCGCLNKLKTAENNRQRCKTHGHCVRGHVSPEYRSWHHMKERCSNPKNKNYDRYGARGISVCNVWDNFEVFLKDMGPKPEPKKLYSIDRIDNNGNYMSQNCRWATQKEQVNNSSRVLNSKKRSNKLQGNVNVDIKFGVASKC